MISEISIENFKSVQKLELELGRVTVFIGANGSGKSNILEAIALCSAAAGNKLDHEFLVSRGIRVPDDPHFLRSAFESQNTVKDIKITASTHSTNIEGSSTEASTQFKCILSNTDNTPYSVWHNVASNMIGTALEVGDYLESIRRERKIAQNSEVTWELLKPLFDKHIPLHLQNFLVYSPENTSLRTFETEGQIQPLGIKGEGLFKLLTVLSREQPPERLAEIKNRLALLDWFDDFDVVNGSPTGERTLSIKDKYLDENLSYFTQKSANEGFLFLLFYFTLFISKETPSFFAIDNIDASLNPKLCRQLLTELVDLAKTHDKQAIVTTHNPAVLDGLDLSDDDQRLYVVSRNKLGHTKVKRVMKPETPPDQKPVRLSEAFLRGYLGGLPGNF